jgi:tetratricopeptide (TPR) repeat protein
MFVKQLLFILLLLPMLSIGQQIPPGLIRQYDLAKTDKEKGIVIKQYLTRFQNTTHQQKLKSYFDLQTYFLKRDDKIALAYIEMGLGALIWSSGDPSTSFRYGVSVLPVFEAIKDTVSILNAYGLIGNSLNVSHNYQQQLHYLWKSHPIAKRFKSDPKIYSTLLNNMADCYAKMGQPDKALPYILEAVQICIRQNQRDDLPTIFCTLGETYFANKEYDMGLAVMHKSLRYGRLGI